MTLLNQLRRGTDQEAAEMLARLRCGATYDQEYHRIQDLRHSNHAVQRQRIPVEPGSVSDASQDISHDDQDCDSSDLMRPQSQPHDINPTTPTSSSSWSQTMHYRS
ncbi:hypothetical protein Slin14017_G076020 [Septoria linicola]|nr:hypothetical protein Slin14017_G076020 [Septoria linicola]